MRISKLIEMLEDIQYEHGDLPVSFGVIDGYRGYDGAVDLVEVVHPDESGTPDQQQQARFFEHFSAPVDYIKQVTLSNISVLRYSKDY